MEIVVKGWNGSILAFTHEDEYDGSAAREGISALEVEMITDIPVLASEWRMGGLTP